MEDDDPDAPPVETHRIEWADGEHVTLHCSEEEADALLATIDLTDERHAPTCLCAECGDGLNPWLDRIVDYQRECQGRTDSLDLDQAWAIWNASTWRAEDEERWALLGLDVPACLAADVGGPSSGDAGGGPYAARRVRADDGCGPIRGGGGPAGPRFARHVPEHRLGGIYGRQLALEAMGTPRVRNDPQRARRHREKAAVALEVALAAAGMIDSYPDGTPASPVGGAVYYISFEDELKAVLNARAHAFGASPIDAIKVAGGREVAAAMERAGDKNPLAVLDEMRASDPRPPALLVIDPLVELVGTLGLSENDNGEMASLMGDIREYAERWGCAVLIAHHTRKGSATGAAAEASRGASAIS